MGKSKTIDRDKLLDAVEEIISAKGTSALTIDAVAKKLNISKGGVQSCFKSKELLVKAVALRWEKNYEELMSKQLPENPSPIDQIKKHIEMTGKEEILFSRAACHLSALSESAELREWLKNWHTKKIKSLGTISDEEKRALVAYLATEGAFYIKYLGLADLTDKEWSEIFSLISQLIEEKLK